MAAVVAPLVEQARAVASASAGKVATAQVVGSRQSANIEKRQKAEAGVSVRAGIGAGAISYGGTEAFKSDDNASSVS